MGVSERNGSKDKKNYVILQPIGLITKSMPVVFLLLPNRPRMTMTMAKILKAVL